MTAEISFFKPGWREQFSSMTNFRNVKQLNSMDKPSYSKQANFKKLLVHSTGILPLLCSYLGIAERFTTLAFDQGWALAKPFGYCLRCKP